MGRGGEGGGGARSGSGVPRESKSHSSSSIHSAHSAAHHTHSQTRLCRSPAGSSQCGRPSWYMRTAKASLRSSRSSGAAPPFGICHVAKGRGVRVVALWRAGTMDAAAAVGLARAWPGALQTTRPTCLPPNPSRPRPPPPDQGCAVRGTALTAAMVATPGEAEPAGGTSGPQAVSTTSGQGGGGGLGGVGVLWEGLKFCGGGLVRVGGMMVIASRSI